MFENSRPHRLTLCATTCALVVMAFATRANATGFLTPIDMMPPTRAHLVAADGRELDGRVTSSAAGPRGTRRLTLKDEAGRKHRFKADEIRQVTFVVEGWMRAKMTHEATTTIEKAAKTDYSQIATAGTLVFDSVVLPDHDHKVLLQRLNPGFDHRIQVYYMSNSKEWTLAPHVDTPFGKVQPFGDEIKTFVVVKDGGEPFKVEKGDYEEQFRDLFRDCPALLEQVPVDDTDFDDFADHVASYQRLCG